MSNIHRSAVNKHVADHIIVIILSITFLYRITVNDDPGIVDYVNSYRSRRLSRVSETFRFSKNRDYSHLLDLIWIQSGMRTYACMSWSRDWAIRKIVPEIYTIIDLARSGAAMIVRSIAVSLGFVSRTRCVRIVFRKKKKRETLADRKVSFL